MDTINHDIKNEIDIYIYYGKIRAVDYKIWNINFRL